MFCSTPKIALCFTWTLNFDSLTNQTNIRSLFISNLYVIMNTEYQCSIQHSTFHTFSFFFRCNFRSVLFQYLFSLVAAGCWLLAAVWVSIQLMNSIRHFNKSSNLIQHHQLCSVLRTPCPILILTLFSLLSFGKSHFVIHRLCWLNILYSIKDAKVDGKIFMSFKIWFGYRNQLSEAQDCTKRKKRKKERDKERDVSIQSHCQLNCEFLECLTEKKKRWKT